MIIKSKRIHVQLGVSGAVIPCLGPLAVIALANGKNSPYGIAIQQYRMVRIPCDILSKGVGAVKQAIAYV